jgi:hypothetical protein
MMHVSLRHSGARAFARSRISINNFWIPGSSRKGATPRNDGL